MNELASNALALMAGAGNRFVMAQFHGAEPSPTLHEAAAALREREGLDGIVFVGPDTGDPAADVRMIVVNADGSRPEACGNGLRCAAAFALERGLARGPHLRVATDSGCRDVELLPDGTLRASLGRATVTAFEVELAGTARRAFDVGVGNPHGVLFAGADEALTLAEVVAALRPLERFAGGVNVELARAIEPGLYRVEVDERGVGPTDSCGTGACAVAAAVWARDASSSATELRLRFAGGELRVSRNENGELLLRGPVEHLAPTTSPPHEQPASSGTR